MSQENVEILRDRPSQRMRRYSRLRRRQAQSGRSGAMLEGMTRTPTTRRQIEADPQPR
jgi:hypothetical protein